MDKILYSFYNLILFQVKFVYCCDSIYVIRVGNRFVRRMALQLSLKNVYTCVYRKK